MLKILSVGKSSRDFGLDHTIEAMFTTVSCRLEPRGRGTRFPAVMGDLYSGYLMPGRAEEALRELEEIESALRRIPVSDVVWSLAEPGRAASADEAVNHRAASVFEYFVDADGQPLVARLRDAVEQCLHSQEALRLAYPSETRDGLIGGLLLALFGVVWMLLGRALIPGWSVAPLYNRRGSLPIWTFGMDFVMLGAGITIAAAFPGVYDWFRRRPPVLITVALAAVIGWLVICARAGFLPD